MFQRQRDQQARNYTAARNTVSIPPVIPCNCCKIKKPQSAFSNQKLDELGTHMKNNSKFRADLQPYIPCIGCSPKQVVELHCHMCDRDKGLNSFSKAQRKNPDHAVCWECAKEREEMEPGESDDDISEGSRDDISDDDDGGEDYSFEPTSSRAGGSTMPGTYSSRNTSGGGVSLLSTSSHAPASSTGGWANSAATTTSTSTVHGDGFTTVTNRPSKQAASSFSAFNPNKYKPAPSVASSSRGRGQWAKVPAVKKAPAKKDSDDESEDDVYLSGSDSD